LLLMILCMSYAWCRWGPGQWSFSPLIQLGQTSLLVYWVHIEFVYGRVSILSKHAQTLASASIGLLLIFLAMLALSLARTKLKGRGVKLFSPATTPASHEPVDPDQEVTAPAQLLRSRNVGGS
jgi:fucose 4-O-acetylase-like acetyltransferase